MEQVESDINEIINKELVMNKEKFNLTEEE